jgi:hypothetical protein
MIGEERLAPPVPLEEWSLRLLKERAGCKKLSINNRHLRIATLEG